MGIHTYEITDSQGESRGAILIQSTVNIPLPLAVFDSAEDADAFVAWCDDRGLIREICTDVEAETVRERWEAERHHGSASP